MLPIRVLGGIPEIRPGMHLAETVMSPLQA